MHRELITRAFEKANMEAKRSGINRPSNNRLAKILSDFISNELKTPIGERRLRDYYNATMLTNTSNYDDINIRQLNVVIGLCNYLGYEEYESFMLETNLKKKKTDQKKLNLSLHYNLE